MDVVALKKANKYTEITVEGSGAIRGKSAYELAVQSGFTGTEAQWLESLKGEKGEPGTTDHAQLTNRDAENQHPIEAVSGLEEISNLDVLRLWNGG